MVAAALIRGTIRATPKSAIFATISEFRRTFLADKSRWMTGGDRPSLVQTLLRTKYAHALITHALAKKENYTLTRAKAGM